MNVQKAEREINEILAELEGATGSVVESLSLAKVEVTTVDDNRQRFSVTARIELQRQPPNNWSL